MTDFTPGPWKVVPWSESEAQVLGVRRIASGPAKGKLPLIALPANTADARLIAAAPDMLEALEIFMAHGDLYDARGQSIARAAIAKARGQS